jgi:serine/alanine adding enzyme
MAAAAAVTKGFLQMNIEIKSGDDRQQWEALIEASSDATIGHLWGWREAIGSAYGFDPIYLVAYDRRGKAIAGVPFIYIRSVLYGGELTSMPYIDYGGVCHIDSVAEHEHCSIDRAMLDRAIEIGRVLKAKRLQVRSPDSFDPRFVLSTEKVTQHLALSKSAEEQFTRLPSERRNRLRHCDCAGLTVQVANSTDDFAIDQLNAVYSANMRELGSPTHSRQFFREVGAHLRDMTSIILVRKENETIAAGMTLEFRGVLSLPWTGATAAAKAVYGTNALYWAAIRIAIDRGCSTFDFGRSSAGSGIFEFKRRWGSVPHQDYWSTLYLKVGAKSPRQRSELRLASSIWRLVPLSVTRFIGPNLRKGISN